MPSKFYAVKKGRKVGVFNTWAECQKQVTGYKGAIFKSFPTKEEAQKFVGGNEENIEETENIPYAFVDGSFNAATKVYGYGGFLVYNGERIILQDSGTDEEMASMRNVAGEILGSMAAMKKAVELGIPKIRIYYDYMGIEMWATGQWKRNKKGTIEYFDYVSSISDKLQIQFVKVKGHSGIEGNEEADRLAKEAVGN